MVITKIPLKHMVKMIIPSAIVLATVAISAAAAEPYAIDVNSIKRFFATLAISMVFLQLPLGIALYTHTTYGKHKIARKLHRSLGYTLLFVFILTAVLCIANYDVDTYTTGISAHIIAGIVGTIAFPLKINVVRTYGGYVPKSKVYGSILSIVFLVLFVTRWIN